jgi:hypothetical protein
MVCQEGMVLGQILSILRQAMYEVRVFPLSTELVTTLSSFNKSTQRDEELD